MGRVLFIAIGLICPFLMDGQYLLELHADANDSFREWEIVLEKDSTEIDGELELTWGLNNDFSEWQYRVEEQFGEISQKFKNNPGFWQLRSDDNVVTMRQVWPGDPSEWEISFEQRAFKFKAIHPNRLDEWSIVGTKFGELVMYTDREYDPRDWIISDYMVDAISFEERMAAIFIALYSSTPKY